MGATDDALLSRIAAATSLFHEHVLAPPSADLAHSPYTERVAFHIYVVHSHGDT